MALNETEILYEIALSIGSDSELEPMLHDALSTLLKTLKASSAQVLQAYHHREEVHHEGLGEEAVCTLRLEWQTLLTLPDDPQITADFKQLQPELALPGYATELPLLGKTLPQTRAFKEGWLHLFNLPGFGVLLVHSPATPLPAHLLPALQKLMNKLAQFCKNCLNEAELHRQIEATKAASKAKSQFLANMSHEIRTPMNGIIGMLDLVLGSNLEREQKEHLDLARMSAEHLLEIINHLLDLSKIEAGKLDLQPRIFDLPEMIGQTVRTLFSRARLKRLELNYDMSPNLPRYVYADPSRLRQMLINLLGNAIKFTQVGEVHLTVERLSSQSSLVPIIEFRIRDTGIGMEPSVLSRVFEPFEQVSSERNRQFEGTGLGLAIVRELTHIMSGEVFASSMPDQGSIFTLQIPMEVASSLPDQATENLNLSSYHLLLVDDQPVNRRVLSAMLTQLNIPHAFATSGPEALFQLRHSLDHRPFDLVLLDANMPGLDGFQIAERIIQENLLQASQVIILTSSAEAGDAARCRALGLNGYLTKPIIMTELHTTLNQLLGQKISHKTRISQSHAEHLKGLHLLLAEDNPINQKLAVKLLEKHQHQVDIAPDGQQAIQLLQSNQYDLVLMDMMMPVMDGLEATRQWRLHEQQHQLPLMPIIAMTANAMQGDKERCLAEGMQGYVAKPVNPKVLYEEIDRVMQEYRPERTVTQPPRVKGELDDLLDMADELLAESVRETPQADQMFDWEKALESLGGDASLLEMALQMLVDEYPTHIEQLKTAWETHDLNQLGAAAHTLKSLLATFGAEAARNQASELERLAKNDTTATNIEPVYNRLQEMLNILLPRLKEQLIENSQ